MRFSWPPFAPVVALFTVPFCSALPGAESAAANSAVVELPPYTVSDMRLLPPPEHWLYARVDGFEVLSNSPARATRELVESLRRFSQALDVVWPGLQRPAEMPTALILCGRGGKFDEFVPADAAARVDRGKISLALRSREQAAIVIDDESKSLDIVAPERTGDDHRVEVDAHQQLSREYIRFVLANTNASFPPWFVEGIAQILMTMEIAKTSITVGRVEDPQLRQVGAGVAAAAGVTLDTPSEWDRTFNGALKRRALLPMEELLAPKPDPNDDERSPLGGTWAKQCAAFVHWGIYGNNHANQKAFLQFVARTAREPASESLFKECFKLSYARMLEELRGYVDFTYYREMEFRAKKGEKLPDLPPLDLRDATQAEIGRIKGDALRLAGRQDAATMTMMAAYIRGERDPQLLAALGLQERARGDQARAAKFLGAAVQARVIRPRAYVELARMQFDEANTASPEGVWTAAQVKAIVTPLLIAIEQPPPLPDAYELLVATWMHAGSPPEISQLKIADEGIRRFPRNVKLIYAAAVLMQQAGRHADAAMIVRHGLAVSPDETIRTKFVALQESLPAPPAK